MREIYLDDAATTRVYPEVVKEMEKYFLKDYGNPSSMHKLGEKARKAMDEARKKIAKEINAKPWEIYFTSGATESNNMALKGLLNNGKSKIIISAIEHPSVIECARYLEKEGYKIVKVPIDGEGIVDINFLERNIDSDINLVSVIHVNNIIGVIQDLEEIGDICKKKGVLFHTDATQSFGRLNIDVKKMRIDMLSASAHKIGGPKGIGFLYVRDGIKIEPMIFGGGQEKNIRSGTENVPAITGFVKALEIHKKYNKEKIRKLRDKMIAELEEIGGKINGSMKKQERIYNNIHVSFPGISNELLVAFLSEKGIYVSAGSACDSKREKEDHVLKAIGLNEKEIQGSVRITMGEGLKEKDINSVIKVIKSSINGLRLNNI